MNRYILTSTITLCMAANACATSFGPSALHIRQINHLPAACLPESEHEAFELKSALVAEDSNNPHSLPHQWSIKWASEGKPLTLLAGQCIMFGQPLAGYRQQGETHPLEAGKTYDFELRRNNVPGGWHGAIYLVVFCVQGHADGSRTYLPYIDNDDGTTTYPSCGRYRGRPASKNGAIPGNMP